MTPRPTEGDIEGNWLTLNRLVEEHLGQEDRLIYTNLLLGLQEDYVVDAENILLGMKRAPAAKGNHHAFEGGLVYHLLEMWCIWERLADLLDQFDVDVTNEHLNDSRILRAIINHDLHKGHRCFKLVSTSPWQTEYAKGDFTQELLTNDTKSLWLLQRAGVVLDEEQLNMLIQAEGGYSPIRPYWTTIAAKVAYMLDELSGNVIGRAHKGKWLGHNQKI